jgi:hypothetical protein
MKKQVAIATLAAALSGMGCSEERRGFEIQPGSEVTIEKKDGVKVVGRLIEVQPSQLILEDRNGQRTDVRRADIARFQADTNARPTGRGSGTDRDAASTDKSVAAAANGTTPRAVDPPGDSHRAETSKRLADRGPEYREVTVPAGTILPVELTTTVASDSSNVEDAVRGTLRRPVTVNGVQALPAGTIVLGHVTAVERAGRMKGRARVAFRFTAMDPPGDGQRVAIRTDAVATQAPATKKHDAAKIGGGAAGGAVVGGILGGGDGAAKGAAIGGAAGTGVVLSTRGKEVRMGPGAPVSVRLAGAVTVRVPVSRS